MENGCPLNIGTRALYGKHAMCNVQCAMCKCFPFLLLSQMQKLFVLAIGSNKKTFCPCYDLKYKNFFSLLLGQMQKHFVLAIGSNAKRLVKTIRMQKLLGEMQNFLSSLMSQMQKHLVLSVIKVFVCVNICTR